jgi:hypothetical protein
LPVDSGRSFNKAPVFIPQIMQRMIKGLVLVKKVFVFGHRILIQLAFIGRNFKINTTVMALDGLLEIVNVDKLNVKLVVVMFYFLELVFGERVAGNFLKTEFEAIDFIAAGTQLVSPGVAFPGKL